MAQKWINYFMDGISGFFMDGIKERGSLEKFLTACNTIEQCGAMSIHGFKYVFDDEDYWQTPEETWARRNKRGKLLGDCDDWARFFVHCLNSRNGGHTALFVVMWNDTSGHATCLQDTQTVGTFKRVSHGTARVGKIASYWYPDWLGYRVYRQSDDGRELELLVSQRRPYEEVQGLEAKKAQNTKDLQAFLDMMAEIDPEVIQEVYENLVEGE